jgi:L-rhamnose isomerase
MSPTSPGPSASLPENPHVPPVQEQPAQGPAAMGSEAVRMNQARISWNNLNIEKNGYKLRNGIVEVPISEGLSFFNNNNEPNTSKRALDAIKAIYDALLDQKVHYNEYGLKSKIISVPK